MRVLHVAYSVFGGGAGAAAARLETATRPLVEATRLITKSGTGIPARRWPEELALRIQRSTNPVHRSLNIFDSGLLSKELLIACDVIHLHWIGSETLSIREVAQTARSKPIVWSLHDTWAFTGADHHPKDLDDIRYRLGYTRKSRLSGDGHVDVDGWVYRRKLRAWKSPIWLVAPSTYVKEMAIGSHLASSWPTTVIPNPIDADVFHPLADEERSVARSELGLPVEGPLVLFGSGSRAGHTKGMDLLAETLERIRVRLPAVSFSTFGPISGDLPTWVQQRGYIDSDEHLRKLYSCADVVLVTSRFETFSQVAAEAQACGTPVAAFATSGLLDVVEDGVSGILADPFDPIALAQAALRVLEAGPSMRLAARERAERLWAMDVVGRQYVAWYERAITEFHENAKRRS